MLYCIYIYAVYHLVCGVACLYLATEAYFKLKLSYSHRSVLPDRKSFARPASLPMSCTSFLAKSFLISPFLLATAMSVHIVAFFATVVTPNSIIHHIYRALGHVLLFALGLKVELHGEKACPTKCPTLVSNHVSLMDIYVLGIACVPLSFLAKEEVADIPFIGLQAKCLGSLFINRGGDRDAAISAITEKQKNVLAGKDTSQLLIFAEGTTTNGNALLKFKLGAFESMLPVQPCILKYSNPHIAFTLLEEHLLLIISLACFPLGTVSVTFLDVQKPKSGETPEKYAERVRCLMSTASGLPTDNDGDWRSHCAYSKELSDKYGE